MAPLKAVKSLQELSFNLVVQSLKYAFKKLEVINSNNKVDQVTQNSTSRVNPVRRFFDRFKKPSMMDELELELRVTIMETR